MQALPQSFYDRPTTLVAQELLGKYLVHIRNGQQQIGKIVEVEAYLGPRDLASHSSKGVTKRTQVMFGPPGYAYVYLIYGLYHCLNVVTEAEGSGSAVLIRALEPIQNISLNTKGPGLLSNALGIDRSFNGHDLQSDNFFITSSPIPQRFTLVKRPRIGVDYSKHWAKRLLRFYIKHNPFVSKL